jgi:hypothetical protein
MATSRSLSFGAALHQRALAREVNQLKEDVE